MNSEKEHDPGYIKGLKVLCIATVLFICLALFLKLLYSLPLKDTALWYIGTFFSFYVPGSLILKFSNSQKEEYFSNFFLSIALGAALTPLWYMLLRTIARPEYAYLSGILMFLLWLILTVNDLRKRKILIYTTFPDIQSAVLLLTMILFLLHLSHFTDVVFLGNGFKVRNTYLSETIFHLGIINVLKSIFLPFYPYASGIEFSQYHLNMHLEIEMFNRYFSLDTIKLTFFYFPLLYFCLLVFMVYIFMRKSLDARFPGILTGILIFGSDLSFIPGLLGMSSYDHLWTRFFTSTIWNLFCLNGQLPALFVMLLCFLYLKKFYKNGNVAYLLVFSILGFSAYGFKSSTGPHIMIATFLTGIVSVVFLEDRKKGWLVCIASILALLMMSADLFLFRGSPTNYILKIDLFNHFHYSLEKFGLTNVPMFFLIFLFPIYVLLTFGVRAPGFYLLKDAFKKDHFDPMIVFLLVFTVSGFIISEVVFLGSPKSKIGVINNADWFAVQSLMGAWLLIGFFLARLRIPKKKLFALAAMLLLFAMPTTVQFLTLRYESNYYPVDSQAMEIVKYLENTKPESVILHPPNLDGPSLAANLAGRASVISFLQSYVIQAIGEKEAENRLADVELFFDPGGGINRLSIVKKYHVRYVYAPVSYSSFLDNEPFLSKILTNKKYVLYRADT